MDAAGIQQIAALLSGGGPVVTIFAVLVAWKAGQTAKEAVTALKEIRDAVVKSSAQAEVITRLVSEIDERTDRIETAVRLLPRVA